MIMKREQTWFPCYRAITCLVFCGLRYHGRWIFTKNAKTPFLALQIESLKEIFYKKMEEKVLFYLLRQREKLF